MDVKIRYMLIFIQILIKKIIITCSVILSSMPKKLYGDNFSTAAAGKSLLISSQRRKESRLVIEREDEARMPFWRAATSSTAARGDSTYVVQEVVYSGRGSV